MKEVLKKYIDFRSLSLRSRLNQLILRVVIYMSQARNDRNDIYFIQKKSCSRRLVNLLKMNLESKYERDIIKIIPTLEVCSQDPG